MTGEKTALRSVLEAEEEPESAQLELLGAPITKEVIEMREEERRGPGRPKGSANKRTTELAAYLLSRYTSPIEVLAQIATAHVGQLAKSINCTKLEALQEKRLAAIALAPYLHAKMPVAVDLTNHKMIHLTITEDSQAASNAGSEDDDVITLTATVLKETKDE